MTDALPEPPVPHNCDLRSFPYMPLDVVRLRDSRLAATATGDEFRAAVLLWCASWHQVPTASLPDDDRELAALAGYGRDIKGWKRVRAVALHGLIKHADGRLYHLVIAEKATEGWRQRQMQKSKAERRWGIATTPAHGNAVACAAALPMADAPAMQGIGNRTEQIHKGEVEPTPALTDPGAANREALAKTLRRLGLNVIPPRGDSPGTVREWADVMQGVGGCTAPGEVLRGILWIMAEAKKTGAVVEYAKHARSLAERWAKVLDAEDAAKREPVPT